MFELIFFIFCVVGMTNIIVDSSLFSERREKIKKESDFWGNVVICHQCCGFWCGLICGTVVCIEGVLLTSNLLMILIMPFKIFLYGCAGSYLASLNTIITDFIVSRINYGPTDEEDSVL